MTQPGSRLKQLFRIKRVQAPRVKAKQALMIASTELRVLTYYSPYQLADPEQRASLLNTLLSTFNVTVALPDDPSGVVYLVVLDNEPILVPEEDVLPFTIGVVLAKKGVDAAYRVSYRPEMLPAVKE